MTDPSSMFREPLDSVHDFFKGRCTAKNDTADSKQTNRLISVNAGKYTFNIHSGVAHQLDLPAAYKAKGFELIDRMVSNPPRKVGTVEDDTMAFYESMFPDIADTAQINLNQWTGKNNLNELSQKLLTEDEIRNGIGIGVIVDCGMKPRFSDHFETIEKAINSSEQKVRYYNLHLMCTDWDEAPKTTKNVYKVHIVVDTPQSKEIPIYGCGVSFKLTSLNDLAKADGMEGGLGGKIDLEHLNINNISVELPSDSDIKYAVTLPHSLLKTKALKLSVPHMCSSVNHGTLKGSFFDEAKFKTNFVKSKHEYLNTVKNSSVKLNQTFFTNYNLQRNNLFFNLKRSMDAGQVELTNWLNKSEGYKLVITEALDGKNKKVHSLAASKISILDPQTLHDNIVKNKYVVPRPDLEKAVIQPGTQDGSKLIPRIDKFVLFTCDRLCYLKAKLLKVPAVYVNATMNQIRVFQGISKPKEEIFVETVRALHKFFYDDTDYKADKERFIQNLDNPVDDIGINIEQLALPFENQITELASATFLSIVQDNSRLFENKTGYDAPERLTKALKELKQSATTALENYIAFVNQVVQGIPDARREFTPFMGAVGDLIKKEDFETFMEMLKKYNRDVTSNKEHIELLDEITDETSLVEAAALDKKRKDDMDFFFNNLASIKKIQRYLQLVLQYEPMRPTYPNEAGSASLNKDDEPNIINVSYDITCNFEPSKAKKIFNYQISNLNQVALHIAENMNIPIMDLLESVYSLFAIEYQDSEIPKGCVNVSNGLDCIRTLQKIYKTFNLRNRSASAEFDKAVQLIDLIERTIYQNSTTLQELSDDIESKANVMMGGRIQRWKREGVDGIIRRPDVRIRRVPTPEEFRQKQRDEAKRRMAEARAERIQQARLRVLEDSLMVDIPDTVSLQDASIDVLRYVDKFIGNVVEIFDISRPTVMNNIQALLKLPENSTEFTKPQKSGFEYYKDACFIYPSKSVGRVLRSAVQVLKVFVKFPFSYSEIHQKVANIATHVANIMRPNEAQFTPNDVKKYLTDVRKLLSDLHRNSPDRTLVKILNDEDDTSDAHFEFMLFTASVFAYCQQLPEPIPMQELIQIATHYTYVLHEDPVLRYLICNKIASHLMQDQQGGNKGFTL
jgi:hypothetical protein